MMKTISGPELREKWNQFRLSKNHKYLPEASLIWWKESTAMFNIAGMQQIIPYLSGKEHPFGERLFNIQKCIRTVDIDDVGDASHLTFFEMMWNRSLGDYFKKEAVDRSREFLVDVLGFDKEKLAATVFEWDKDSPRDEETAGYWKKYLPENKIAYLPADNNRRSPGPVWPCGPDTEIFYRVGESEFPTSASNPWNDEKNWLEIWNNVFMEFYKSDDGKLTKLDKQNVDTGMWYERMCKVLQQKNSVYETDIFDYILTDISKSLNMDYDSNIRKFRIIADHTRTSFFMIKDGISPSNEWRWYVLRRLIRRMYYNLSSLKKVSESDLKDLLTNIAKNIVAKFSLDVDLENIVQIILKECLQFQKTIENGQKMIGEFFQKSANSKKLSWKDIFMLYDTFGFPIELTRELASEKWFQLDEAGFDNEMIQQQERSRRWSKDKFTMNVDRSKHVAGIEATKFIGYEQLESDQVKLLKDFNLEDQRILIFDKTPFYAESGWQVGDKWIIELESGEKLKVKEVKKYEWVFLHFVE